MLDRIESELVQAAQQGSRPAFGELVARYQNLVTSIAFSRTGDLQRSEDIAQQAFLVAWQKRESLRDVSRFGGWLCSITRNLTRNSNRKSTRVDRSAAPLESVAEPSIDSVPGAQMISSEQQELLWATLENIPEEYREPLILFYREEQSVKQVARKMGLSTDAVKQRLSRGRSMLKAEVQQFVEEALGSTKPKPAFSAGIMATLPAASAAASKAMVKGGTAVGFKSLLGKLGVISTGPLLGALGGVLGSAAGISAAWYSTKAAEQQATSEEEKRLLRRFFWKVIAVTILFSVISILLVLFPSGQITRAFLIVASVIVYSIGLTWMVFQFVRNQKALHAQHGVPAYAQASNPLSPAPINSFRFALLGTTFGCWSWLFVMATIRQQWTLIAVATIVVGMHLAWLWARAARPQTSVGQIRFQAIAMSVNSLLAGGLVILAGWFGASFQYGSFGNLALGLSVIVVCWLIASVMWLASFRLERAGKNAETSPNSGESHD